MDDGYEDDPYGDDGYGEDPYGEDPYGGEDGQEEAIEDVIEVEYFNTEELLRKGNFEEALASLEDIYTKSEANNLRNWRIKAISQILQVNLQLKRLEGAKKSLMTIREINEKEKISETTIKSIVYTLQALQPKAYGEMMNELLPLIETLETNSQLKSYLMMMEREIKNGNIEESMKLQTKIRNVVQQSGAPINVGTELEFFSLELKLAKMQGKRVDEKLKKYKVKLPMLEEETTINDAHLSEIKEAIAELLYEEYNYKDCARYLCDCFLDNAKFGRNSDSVKRMLKINVIVVLLSGDTALIDNKKYNPLKDDSTAAFKMDPDIQGLFGLIEAFNSLNLKTFMEILKVVDISPTNSDNSYQGIQGRIVLELKKQMIHHIVKPYKTVKLAHLMRRVEENMETVMDIVLGLIADKKIHGKIYFKEEYLEITPPASEYYEMQISNLRDLTERM